MKALRNALIALILWQCLFVTVLQQPLLDYSLDNLPHEKKSLPLYLTFFDELGQAHGYLLAIVLICHSLRKDKAITLCMTLTFAGLLYNMQKLILLEPRPYFVRDSVPKSCKDLEYGNPSGHSMVFTCFYITFARMVIKNKYLHVPVYLICGALAYSRFIMGVHSLDQIWNGFVQGLIFAFYITSEGFAAYMQKLQEYVIRDDVTFLSKLKTAPFMVHLIMALAIPVLNYFQPALPQQYIEMIEKNCGIQVTGSEPVMSSMKQYAAPLYFFVQYIGWVHYTKTLQPKLTFSYMTNGLLTRLFGILIVSSPNFIPKSVFPNEASEIFVRLVIAGQLVGAWLWIFSNKYMEPYFKDPHEKKDVQFADKKSTQGQLAA